MTVQNAVDNMRARRIALASMSSLEDAEIMKALASVTMLVAFLSAPFSAVVHGQAPCQIQILDVVYPQRAEPGQSVEVKTAAVVNFVATQGDKATGRADLRERESGRILLIRAFDIGYSSTPKTVTVAVSHVVTAPAALGIWSLEVRLYCLAVWSAPSQLVNDSRFFDIQIEAENPATTATTIAKTTASQAMTEIVSLTTQLQTESKAASEPSLPAITSDQLYIWVVSLMVGGLVVAISVRSRGKRG